MDDNISLIALASVLSGRLETRRLVDEAINKAETKNLCAKVAPELADEVQQMARFLKISKRLFVEQAVIDALDRASEVIWNQAEDDDVPSGTVPSFVYQRVTRYETEEV